MSFPFPALFPLTYLVFIVAERIFPRRRQAQLPRWSLKGILFFALGGLINGLVAPRAAAWGVRYHFIEVCHLGTVAGALVGLVVGDLVGYWSHRLRHACTPLWRLHQLHHSSERLDAVGAFYFHPLESVLVTGMGALVGGLIGLSPGAATWTGYLFFLLAVFQHVNLRTPRWLGLLVQRPEQHAVHHQRGVHAFNYGATTLWDRLFRTYRDPEGSAGELGFWPGASRRLGAMLIGRDVSVDPARGHTAGTR